MGGNMLNEGTTLSHADLSVTNHSVFYSVFI